jgi:tetraacyldisaccharide 4'-kinase
VAGWLARELGLRGHRVGIVLRGYGGSHRGPPRVVMPTDDPLVTGDEALVHAGRGAHVVVIGADRVAAAQLAVRQGAEIVLCDDGLQHLRLGRDYEIAVVDAARRLGNGCMLPAGPLREPARRLESVQAVVLTLRRGKATESLRLHGPLELVARLRLGAAVNVVTGERRDLASFASAPPLHAVAGIGHPAAFFSALRDAGISCTVHALPDHARLDLAALPGLRDATVMMTEKDAVKCRGYGQPGWWWVELDVDVERSAADLLLASILERAGLIGAGVRIG